MFFYQLRYLGSILRALSPTSPRLGLGPLTVMRGSGADGGILIHHWKRRRLEMFSRALRILAHNSLLVCRRRPEYAIHNSIYEGDVYLNFN